MKYKKLFIFLIFILALVLRLFKLGSFPSSLNRDEAAIGWNAYSILKTGKDEWGKSFPVSFKSFGDYKMPLYIYASVPFIDLFGLSEFSVRFVSAFFGGLTVLVLYYLVKTIFSQNQSAPGAGTSFAPGARASEVFPLANRARDNPHYSLLITHYLPVIAGILLAIFPWHVFYSRIGFEANFALFLISAGFTMFLYAFKRPALFIFSAIFLGLSFYAYSSIYVFLPIMICLTAVIYRKKIFNKKDLLFKVLAVIIFSVLLFHAGYFTFKVSKAKQAITIFSDPGIIDQFNRERTTLADKNLLFAKLWMNKPFYFARIVFKNYILTFSPKFLFISGGKHPWHSLPGFGNFYKIDIIFALLGLYVLVKKKAREKWFVLSWLLVSPLASAITVDAPHSTRSLQMLIPMIIIISLGIVNFFEFVKGRRKIFLYFIPMFYVLSSGLYFYNYFFVYPKNLPESLKYGLKEAILYVKENKEKEDAVYFNNPPDAYYVYTLFYMRPEPEVFYNTFRHYGKGVDQLEHVLQFDNFYYLYEFPKEKEPGFYILRPEKCFDESKVVKRIKNPKGGLVLVVCKV